MKSGPTVAFVVALLAPVTHALAQNEVRLSTPKGDLVVRDLRISPKNGSQYLEGVLENGTSADISTAEFEVIYLSKKGVPTSCILGPCTFSVFRLPAGKATDFDSHILLKDFVPPANVARIALKKAEYKVVYSYSLVKSQNPTGLGFEDGVVKVVFLPGESEINFELTNKTDNPIKIDWGSVSYVDPAGKAHRVIHTGVKLADRDAASPPTIIPPTARIEDLIVPTDNIYYTSGRYGGWSRHPLFPTILNIAESEKNSILKGLEGKTFTLFMPIEIEGKSHNYTFVFRIDQVKL